MRLVPKPTRRNALQEAEARSESGVLRVPEPYERALLRYGRRPNSAVTAAGQLTMNGLAALRISEGFLP